MMKFPMTWAEDTVSVTNRPEADAGALPDGAARCRPLSFGEAMQRVPGPLTPLEAAAEGLRDSAAFRLELALQLGVVDCAFDEESPYVRQDVKNPAEIAGKRNAEDQVLGVCCSILCDLKSDVKREVMFQVNCSVSL